jgi:uncharacterized coiled-coil DUF342 family protein
LDESRRALEQSHKEYATLTEQWQQKLQHMEAILAQSHDELAQYHAEANTARTQAQGAYEAMLRAQQESENARRALGNILASRTWRALEPIRQLRRFLRGSAQ